MPPKVKNPTTAPRMYVMGSHNVNPKKNYTLFNLSIADNMDNNQLDNVSRNSNKNTGKIISVIEKEVENPYKYYTVSRENLLPLFIYIVVGLLLFLVGVLLHDLLIEGYMTTQNMIIFAIITLFLVFIIFVIIQNSKHIIWEKDRLIRNLKSNLDVKDDALRDLKGNVSELKTKLSKLTAERNNLRIEMEHVKEELQTCISVKKSYEEKVKPYIELKSFMTVERGKILGILKVDDIYNVSFENKGYAPAFNIEGKVVYFPVSGKNISFPISIAKLLPNENLSIPLGGKKTLKECSKIIADVKYKDIIGNIHQLEEEML